MYDDDLTRLLHYFDFVYVTECLVHIQVFIVMMTCYYLSVCIIFSIKYLFEYSALYRVLFLQFYRVLKTIGTILLFLCLS